VATENLSLRFSGRKCKREHFLKKGKLMFFLRLFFFLLLFSIFLFNKNSFVEIVGTEIRRKDEDL